MNIIIISCLVTTCICGQLFSQTRSNSSTWIYAHAGKNRHGTGDLKGFYTGLEVQRVTPRQISWGFELSSTMNKRVDHSDIFPRFVHLTYGLQLIPKATLRLLGNSWFSGEVAAGPLLRYQVSSYPTTYGFTTSPDGLVFYDEQFLEDPQRFSVGYQGELKFVFTIFKTWQTGLRLGIQNDTHGDILPFTGLFIGKIMAPYHR